MAPLDDDTESRDGSESNASGDNPAATPEVKDQDVLLFWANPNCKTLQKDLEQIHTTMKRFKTDLNKTMNDGMDSLNGLLTNATTGVIPRLQDLEQSDEKMKGRVLNLEEKLAKVVNSDTVILQATPSLEAAQQELSAKVDKVAQVLHALEGKINSCSSRILYNMQHNQANNFKISGILFVEGEDPLLAASTFFKDIMEITVEDNDILVAYHLPGTIKVLIKGTRVELPPQMTVKVTSHLQKRILANQANLEDKEDPTDGHFYKVHQQLPDAMVGARQHFNKVVADLVEENKHLPKEKRKAFYFQGTNLFINGCKVKEPIMPPSRASILQITLREQKILDLINPPVLAQQCHLKSKFFAYVVRVYDLPMICQVYKRLRQLHLQANHVIMVFRIDSPDEPGKVLEGSCHDEESHGDVHLAMVLEQTYMSNIVVFVIRYYGGMPLRGLHLKAIMECAVEALHKLCFPENPDENQDPTPQHAAVDNTSEMPGSSPKGASSQMQRSSPVDLGWTEVKEHSYHRKSPSASNARGGLHSFVGSRFKPGNNKLKKQKLDFDTVMPYSISY